MHVELQTRLDVDSLHTIWCHKNCVCSYVSPQWLNRHLKRQGNEPKKMDVPMRQRHSDISSFRFLEHCLFCGPQCSIHSARFEESGSWRRAVLCRTADRGSGSKTFKRSILDTCNERNDEWAGQVSVHVEEAISDLNASDGRYDVDCMSKFMNNNNNNIYLKSDIQCI